MPLLVAYCNATAQEQRAAAELMVAMVQGGAPSPWLAVHASAVRSQRHPARLRREWTTHRLLYSFNFLT
jgi:hypothetical protein